MIKKFNFILLLILSASFLVTNVSAQEALGNAVPSNEQQHEEIDVRELILEHLADTYEWHLFTINEEAISIPLPIILISKEHGFNIYSSSVLEEVSSLNMPFYIAPDGPYKGKIVERNRAGDEVRPLDLSITKNAASILLSSLLLILIIMSVARHYKEESLNGKKGFSGGMEFLIEIKSNAVSLT